MILRWRPASPDDREAIMQHIETDNPQAAVDLDNAFEAKADKAKENPLMYRQGRVPGTREIVVHTNYVMVYRIVDDAVEVLRVLHAAQQWPRAVE